MSLSTGSPVLNKLDALRVFRHGVMALTSMRAPDTAPLTKRDVEAVRRLLIECADFLDGTT